MLIVNTNYVNNTISTHYLFKSPVLGTYLLIFITVYSSCLFTVLQHALNFNSAAFLQYHPFHFINPIFVFL